jgi:hypothetical protein
VSLLELTVNTKAEETYANLKVALTARGCTVTSEQPPTKILAKQGSLWGITPKTAKKNLTLKLTVTGTGTQVSCSTKLTSDWKNITVLGCISAAVLMGVCIWIAVDLADFLATGLPSFWSWILAGGVHSSAGQAFVNLAWGLAVFLALVILLEAGVVVYVQPKIDAFAQEVLNATQA